ncbi:DnaT-like ssDNA-binding domain-containing protein [Escherichia albertii]|uniref:DnaT-like ssDNA-binding domain-containing protein n=1 Tax=Escherichia albertii TaxID=208962 RepID=UPI00185E8B19|nr:DnaT-like ssDNA-binding domain-containing protein [Escherichia albertii]EGE0300373.1 hypothetical protein [Escherichia albertii]EKD4813939.1 hypothetical protein [Escherichia albertii]MCI5277094.1 hypothetical protein [Escherichia albertii]MCZ8662673.1 DnaT-like ssDNA-binding domain-containing protein [Escherichia albertii]MCZ8703635.1 DnaT-like ssDNA-binding domain-containing protein [Escherichia albertii]
MASSWIKVEVITPDKPEIFQIAEILGIDPDAVLGKLVRIWAWADQQTIDGNAGSVTKGVLDRLAFITGFADALISVGWLAYHDGKLTLPNFERHNGESSKKRALTNRRVAEHRKRVTQKVTPAALQKELPEEEEDIYKTPHIAHARESDPTSGENDMLSQAMDPKYLDGMSEPIGKFPMTDGWLPSPDFRRRASVWGVALPEQEFTPSVLAAFRDYWAAEGKIFTQVQWEQKFARHVNHIRGKSKNAGKSDELDWNNTDWIEGVWDEINSRTSQ